MRVGGPGRWFVLIGVLSALSATGCGGVNRRFVIESNVPSAQVYINDKPIGAAPAHSAFEFYGYYKISLVHPDYQTLTVRQHVIAPWYAYPPFDFLAEVVWPFGMTDVRRYYYNLVPLRQTDTAELIINGDALRERGQNLPPPPPPPYRSKPPATPILGPPVAAPVQSGPIAPLAPPDATAIPSPAPGATPQPRPAPAATPGPTPALPSVLPSVTPSAGFMSPRSETYDR
jgi:hypothetical protein